MSCFQSFVSHSCLSCVFYFFFLWAPPIYAVEVSESFYDEPLESFEAALKETQQSLSEYIDFLNRQSPELVCLGETHNNQYRSFYTETFFSRYRIDTLMLETTADRVETLVQEALVGGGPILLGSPIGPLIRQAKSLNPELKIVGIEATSAQRAHASFDFTKQITRESFIAQNFMDNYEPGKRHVILIGSLHCSSYDRGLGNRTPAYVLLKRLLPENSSRSVQTLFFDRGSYFTAKTSSLELGNETIVFKDTPDIHDDSFKRAWQLKEIFTNFDDLIYAQ